MSNWYVNKKGRAEGPISLVELKALLSSDSLGPDDLVYREGENKWRPISEFSELNKEIKPKAASSDIPEPRKWVLLLKDPSGFKQKGPYSSGEVLKKIEKGEATLFDHVWREGMKEWYKIQAVYAELKGDKQVDSTPHAKPLPKDVEDLLKNVMIQQSPVQMQKSNIENSSKPPEAVGPDLAKYKIDPRDQFKTATVTMPGVKTKSHNKADTKTHTKTNKVARTATVKIAKSEKSKRGLGPRLVYYILSALVLMGAGAYYLFYFQLKSERPDNKLIQMERVERPKAKVETKPPPVVVQQETIQEKETKNTVDKQSDPIKVVNAPEAKKPPTYIKLIRRKDAGIEKLTVASDGSSHYPVQIEFIGARGTLLGYKSYRTLRVFKRLNEREIILEKLRIPVGRFEVIGRIDGLEDKESVSYGIDKDTYRRDLNIYNKSIAFEHMSEKRSFITHLTSFRAALLPIIRGLTLNEIKSKSELSRRVNQVRVSGVDKINNKNRGAFLFAPEYFSLKSILSEMAGADPVKDRESLLKVAPRLDRMLDQAQKTSLWD